MAISPVGPALPSVDAALVLHRQGALAAAARAYQDLLAVDPEHADALHLLGVLAHQRGDSAQAVELIHRAIGLRPSVAAYHANLAEVYRARGQLDRAAGCGRTALRLNPQSAEAANNLGLILLQQGKPDAARDQFQTALRLRPDFALACNNLANAWRLLGDADQAVAHLRQALTIDPTLAEAHTNLGQLLMERGEMDQALVHTREAVRRQPDGPEGHNNLGNVLRALGRLAEARASYAEALRLDPDLALTHRNMGQALQEEGKLAEAVLWYRQALDLDPNAAPLHGFLAGALEEQENFADAAVHYERAVQLEPADACAHNGLGWVRHEQGRFAQALEHYRTALCLEPDFPAAQCNLAYALEELGDFAEAERTFRDVLRQHPHHAGAHAQLATMLRGRLPAADQQALEQVLADPDGADDGRLGLHFALAHVLDARGAYEQAADHLRQANALAQALRRQRGRQYDPAEHGRFVDNLLAAFTPAFFERTAGFGLDTERPVFIVGLPRSGTTLTEQILARHSQAFGAGELRLARDAFFALAGPSATEAGAFEPLARLDAETVRRTARRHLEGLHALDAGAARIVDKMPDNYLYLGLLAVLFPRAKFVHCRRDLRDVAASCWMTNFRHIRWANDPDHIAARFADYERLMAHWRRVLPVPVLEVRYEETVADLEGTARQLLAFCGLEWEPACLAFHEGRRPIRTASITQVRQPLYRHAVGRWRHYEKALDSLFARLPGSYSVLG
jgi:tetratricopeptide (TPR) repeat protein